tara:strand:+ start:14717 stop:15475 length:759 start_codon:yes stop_codon:yes gene_type:complete
MKQWMRVALPNVFTLGSIFCGVSAIFYCIDGFNSLTGDPGRAPWLIIAAALLDCIDGKIARFSQGATTFGVELDSLADVISFGVAPAVLVYTLRPFGDITWVLCLLFLMCGAIRLARYNVMTFRQVDRINQEKDNFMGLPIPVAAIAVASYVIFCWDRWEELHMEGPFMGFLLLLSLLMISPLSYRTLPSLAFKSKWSILKLIIMGGALGVLIWNPQVTIFPIVLLYIFSGIAAWGIHIIRHDEDIALSVED